MKRRRCNSAPALPNKRLALGESPSPFHYTVIEKLRHLSIGDTATTTNECVTMRVGLVQEVLVQHQGLNESLHLGLLRLEVEQGQPKAQYKLASMLYTGDGIPKDKVEARRLFRLAASQGDSRAAAFLSL